MIGRGFRRDEEQADGVEVKGFDDFDLRLGDLMRGERATMGKSLLDVQRELRIKAAYIAAIENADPSAFDTPGFIAGYVRSYARYLNMDPDWAFETFCRESGFTPAHGMSTAASGRAGRAEPIAKAPPSVDAMFDRPSTPFAPGRDALFSNVEPGAIGSMAVLLALVVGLGYGAWNILQEVQRVQLAPVEAAPTVASTLDIDPLAGGASAGALGPAGPATPADPGVRVSAFEEPAGDVLDRLYRPDPLDVPVMVARDGPIGTLDPDSTGVFAPDGDSVIGTGEAYAALDPREGLAEDPASVEPTVQVTEAPEPGVALVAVRPAWVRVRAADGTVLYETIMEPGDRYDVPQTEEPATLRIGESGAVYFLVDGQHYGPVGPRGQVTSNLALSVENLTASYQVADIAADADLAEVVRVAELERGAEEAVPQSD